MRLARLTAPAALALVLLAAPVAAEAQQSRHPSLVVVGAAPAARAMKQATRSIPIVMWAIGDPVEYGLVPSHRHRRPEGNVTGTSYVVSEVAPKLVELLKEARAVAQYVDRILKGTAPADLPIAQPTKFELASI